VAQALFPDSIYTSKLRRKGIRLHAGRDIDLLEAVPVAEVMTHDVPTVNTGLTLPELSEQFSRTHHHSLIVVADDGRIWGIVTVTDLDRAVAKNRAPTTPVSAIGTPRSRLTVTHPDESVAEALARLGIHDVGSLPVLSREEPEQLVGVIRREEILHAYTKALSRRGEIQHRVRRAQSRNLEGMEFIVLTLVDEDQAVGKTLQELAPDLPEECIVVSLQRDSRVLVPHGNTTFQPGDRITVFARSEEREHLQRAIHGTIAPRPDHPLMR